MRTFWRSASRALRPQPVFLPLYNLFLIYGKARSAAPVALARTRVLATAYNLQNRARPDALSNCAQVFRLSFGPKSFVVVSDPAYVKDILLTNAKSYSKGLLAEILDFVMGQGLIPADGEHWRIRRRAILPSLHKRYVAAMLDMFGECGLHGAAKLEAAAAAGQSVEMENFFSRLALDIIGKAVFNYNFDALTHDDPVIAAVYTALREAEYRSIAIFPYWNFPPARWIVPRQRKVTAALAVINTTLDVLIADCKALVEESDEEFVEEYLNRGDPSILRFLIASGDKVSSKQLRDDLMTLLIAGHETTAAVLTWTFYLLAKHPDVAAQVRAEVDAVCGDRLPTMEDTRALAMTTRVINEVRRCRLRRQMPACRASEPRRRVARPNPLPWAGREVSLPAPDSDREGRCRGVRAGGPARVMPRCASRAHAEHHIQSPSASLSESCFTLSLLSRFSLLLHPINPTVDAAVPAAARAAAARHRGRAHRAVRRARGRGHLHQHVEPAPLASAVGPPPRL